MKDFGKVEMHDLSKDYPSASEYVGKLLKENGVSKAMIAETLVIFEALCYRIFEQRQNPDCAVILSGFRRMGDSAIELSFEGGMYDPEPEDPSRPTPEDRILRAYADKIDYSYRSGRNRITITMKRNHLYSVGLYAFSMILGILVYTLLRYTASEKLQYFVAEKLVFPTEHLFINAVLMIGAPVTFLSMLKHLTDTYILAESASNARRLHRNAISSSILSVVLAILSSWVFTDLFFSDDDLKGKYTHGMIDLDLEKLIPSLIPSDIFTPFQTMMPYSLIILAVLTTYAFCSVGKYFDMMKTAIDAAYVLFARMLSVVMYALPLCAFLSILDELFSDGYISLLYLAEMIAVAFASLGILLGYYVLRLLRSGVKPRPFLAKMVPLMRENARIASAFDAVPYNIRYCARAFSFDRSRMEQSMPVLAQINLDGNCFIITMLAMLYVAVNSTPLSFGDTIAVGILVLFLSIGAPNQPGSCLLGLTIVMVFLEALPLGTVAIVGEVFFGGMLNLVNIAGDIVTIATEEVRETGTAEQINEAAAN